VAVIAAGFLLAKQIISGYTGHRETGKESDNMFNPYVRPANILGDSRIDVESILRNCDQVILSQDGKSTAVIIGIQEYEQLKEAMYDRYVLQKLSEAEAVENNSDAWGTEDELMRVVGA
jgi:PHD/YefM family antitoxin component YafN of YafNO toxin-antitoxin module